MLNGLTHRARWAFAAGTLAVGPLVLGGCNLRHELVAVQTPGVIDAGAVSGPVGANGLRVGALGSLKLQTGSAGLGETLWQLGGLLTDEWKSSNTSSATNEVDQRAISTSNASVTTAYNNIQQSRGYLRDAITAMQTYLPAKTSQIGELYFGLAFVEMQMAEDFCNGIPFGTTTNGVVSYGPAQSTQAVYTLASAHFDTALALSGGTDTASIRIQREALVGKARLLVDLGQFGPAATFTASVPTTFQYTLTFSVASGDNGNWNLNTSQTAYTVADSFDAAGVIKNAVPFVSAKDVRVPTANPNKTGIDGQTPLITQSIWAQTGQVPLVSGIDARLIEAEVDLNLHDLAGMTTILNTLRTTAQTMGTFKPAVQAALTQPATQAAAMALFFREKAFWTFGRGQRLGDLRRQVRQYGLASTAVFPTGAFLKGGNYGNDVNLPVPDAERVNPLFNGCLDRGA